MQTANDLVKNLKPDTECVTRVEQKQPYRKIGSIKIIPGHTIFGLNLVTGELKPVQYEEKPPELNIATGEERSRKQAIHNSQCQYFSALNVKNAEKKANRIIGAIKAKTEFLKDHQHLIVSNLPFWGELERMGFQEYSDTIRTVGGFNFTVMFDDESKEEMMILSIVPTITKEEGNAYQLIYEGCKTTIKEHEITKLHVMKTMHDSLRELRSVFLEYNSFTKNKKLVSFDSLKVLKTLIKSFKLQKNETI